MKTKLTLLFIAFVAGTSAVMAQATEECITTMSIFSEHAKVKNYDAAYEPFMKLRKDCPKTSFALYQYGERLLNDKIDKATGAEKTAFAKDLIAMYEEKYANFPDKTEQGSNISDIAQVMYDNGIGTKMEQYKKFQEAWDTDKKSFTNAKSLYVYFTLAVELQESGELELQDIFNLYDDIQGKITEEQNNYAENMQPLMEKEEAGTKLTSKELRSKKIAEGNLENYSKVAGAIDGKLGKLADCDNLIPLYQKDFEAKKDDIDWIKRAAGRMSGKECTEDPLFIKLVEQLDKLEPSAKTAYYLGQLAEKSGDNAKALEYYEESANRETNNDDKARVLGRIGDKMMSKNSYSSARSYYRKALQAKPSAGIYYLKIAQMYAASANNCGNSVFDKRAVYWLAADYAARAGRIDPALASHANATAASYRAKAPDKTMIFNAGNQGQKINFNCWIGESVTVPSL
ncbi:tetratricopeptide repeat protein [Leeuwenhoekiella sp. A16]|uniref:tetratricopeptide repeat protein n=1 Tax=unclassified Leeuwenhoekiella TaxID=2615029 RepID=UPI003A7F6AB3